MCFFLKFSHTLVTIQWSVEFACINKRIRKEVPSMIVCVPEWVKYETSGFFLSFQYNLEVLQHSYYEKQSKSE